MPKKLTAWLSRYDWSAPYGKPKRKAHRFDLVERDHPGWYLASRFSACGEAQSGVDVQHRGGWGRLRHVAHPLTPRCRKCEAIADYAAAPR